MSNDYYNVRTLPIDSIGEHTPKILGSTEAPYGYYVYKPSYYDAIDEVVFPVLIFLHGSGEKGNSMDNAENLKMVLRNGPPKLIENKTWLPPFPMLVFSPQCHDNGWNADKLKEFTDYIIANYKVNVERIYLTGLSMGGYGSWAYIGK